MHAVRSQKPSETVKHTWGFTAIRHFFLDFCHGEMAKMARKIRHFAIDFCHDGENGGHFLTIFAIIFRHFSIFAILTINFLAIFAIMAKMEKKNVLQFFAILIFPQKSMAKWQ